MGHRSSNISILLLPAVTNCDIVDSKTIRQRQQKCHKRNKLFQGRNERTQRTTNGIDLIQRIWVRNLLESPNFQGQIKRSNDLLAVILLHVENLMLPVLDQQHLTFNGQQFPLQQQHLTMQMAPNRTSPHLPQHVTQNVQATSFSRHVKTSGAFFSLPLLLQTCQFETAT